MIEVSAVVKRGKLVLESPMPFPDGMRVRVMVAAETSEDPLLWLIENAVDTGITDLADEHDHYIYGTPKRKEKPSNADARTG